MNKLTVYLGDRVYAESFNAVTDGPSGDLVKLYTDEDAAQGNIIWLDRVQIDALKKFLAQIEEGCE